MTSTAIETEEITIVKKINDYGELTGNILNIFEIIILICTIIGIAIVVNRILNLRKKINKVTLSKINVFKKNNKYIDGIFVEINDSKEYLRYYLNGTKWKSKVITEYNKLFNTYSGKLINDSINNYTDIKLKMNSFMSLAKIKKCIDNTCVFVKNIRRYDDGMLQNDTGHLRFFLGDSFYGYEEILDNLKKKLALMNEKHILILGNAGNGKTNLLCNFVELVIKYKQPCIFINSKDIKENIETLLFKELHIPKWFENNNYQKLFLIMYCFLLLLGKQNLYIIIDAINENDVEGFRDNLKNFFNGIGTYKNIKILVSCRNEYFDERFGEIFNETIIDFHRIKIDKKEYKDREKEKLIYNYKNHFNYKGNIAGSVRKKLLNSLILTRIFFEANRNKKGNPIELKNAEIYKKYIKNVAEEANRLYNIDNFEEIIKNIVDIMLSNNKYDEISIKDLNLEKDNLDKMKKVLDGNLIISNKLTTGKGIVEEERECIYFIYDELRDYCISKNILMKSENNEDFEYGELFKLLDSFYENKSSPFEGVLKYTYYYIKYDSSYPDKLNICKKILNQYGKPLNDDSWNYDKSSFKNYGITIILSDCSKLEDFEFEYILKSMSTVYDYWHLLNILFDNEISEIDLKTDIFIKLLFMYDLEGTIYILEKMLEDVHEFSDMRQWSTFRHKVLSQENISSEMKWILILMSIKIYDENFEKCFKKFNINKYDIEKLIKWLENINYPYLENLKNLLHTHEVYDD